MTHPIKISFALPSKLGHIINLLGFVIQRIYYGFAKLCRLHIQITYFKSIGEIKVLQIPLPNQKYNCIPQNIITLQHDTTICMNKAIAGPPMLLANVHGNILLYLLGMLLSI